MASHDSHRLVLELGDQARLLQLESALHDLLAGRVPARIRVFKLLYINKLMDFSHIMDKPKTAAL